MNETDGDVTRKYVVDTKGMIVESQLAEKRPAIGQLIKEIFLPAGYPASVTNDYLQFYTWQFVQGLANSITSMLSAQAILKGVGVGEATATSAAAALQLAIKDAVGKLTWIYFAWAAGSQLDCDAKKWRLIADFANDFGIFFELLAPFANLYMPFGFMTFAIIGNIAKTIAGVAGGATRFTMVQHFAKRENVADISAKAGSQDVLCGLLGMVLGMMVAHFVGENAMLCWATFVLFGALHLFANYQALLIIVLNTLNRTRAYLLFQEFGRTGKSVLLPVQVAQLEGIGFGTSIPQPLATMVLGAHVPQLAATDAEWRALTALYADERYLLTARAGRIVIGLHTVATPEDIIKSLYNAFVLHSLSARGAEDPNLQLLEKAHRETQKNSDSLFSLLKTAGWNVATAQYLRVAQTRITWALKTT